MPRLAEHFEVFAVDLRGQGRSTRTPGRYTLDNMGNDLVRFIDLVIGRPTIVSGLSSGGVLSAWLSAYAKPGQIVAACYEDPPLFASEVRPATGPGHPPEHRPDVRPVEHLPRRPVVDRRVGRDARRPRPTGCRRGCEAFPIGDEPRQELKEYDPEWGRAFWSGTVGGVVRPRADAAQRQGAQRAAHPPLPRRRREHRHPDGRARRRAGRRGCRSCSARPA